MEDSKSQTSQQLVVVGKISSAYGIKGWVNVYSYTNPVTNILQYQPWYLSREGKDAWEPVRVISGRQQGKQVVAQIEGCQDRNKAELYRGLEIAVDRGQLPEPEQSEHYWIDLIGLTVVTVSGEELGVLDSILETGANDVLVVKDHSKAHSKHKKEHLIPFVQNEFVREIDMANGRITVDWDPDF